MIDILCGWASPKHVIKWWFQLKFTHTPTVVGFGLRVLGFYFGARLVWKWEK